MFNPSSKRPKQARPEENTQQKSDSTSKLQAVTKSEAKICKNQSKTSKDQIQEESRGFEDSFKDQLTDNLQESILLEESNSVDVRTNKKRKPNQTQSDEEPSESNKLREMPEEEIEQNLLLKEKGKRERQQSNLERLRERAKIAQTLIHMIEDEYQRFQKLQQQRFQPKSGQQKSEQEKEAKERNGQNQPIESEAFVKRIMKALEQLNVNAQNRDEFLELFTKGVVLPQEIFHQKRIQHAKMGPVTDRRFIYCPNSIITSQIFSILGARPPLEFVDQSRVVLKGYKGISKTVSVSLLWYLTRFIDEYRFHQSTIEQKKALKINNQQQSEQFKQPKIVYWSLKNTDTFQSVVQNLLEQLPEFKKAYLGRKIINLCNQLSVDIGAFYKKNFGVQVKIIIDQISFYASEFRTITNAIKDLQRTIAKEQKKLRQSEQKTDIETIKQKLTEAEKKLWNLTKQIQLVKNISQIFSKTVYLSSMDLEEAFLKENQLHKQNGHEILHDGQVQYSRFLYQPQVMADLCHFYIFGMNERVLKPQNKIASQKLLEQAQEDCIQLLRERLNKQEYFYLTFCNIFKQVKKLQKQKSQFSDIKSYLKNKFAQVIEFATENEIKQFQQNFPKKDDYKNSQQFDPLRKKLLLDLRLKTQEIVVKQKLAHFDKNKAPWHSCPRYVIDLKDLGLSSKDQIHLLPQTLIAFQTNYSVRIRLPAKLAHRMLSQKAEDCLSFDLENANSWMNKNCTKSSLGSTIQKLFILALKKGKTNFTMKKTNKYCNIKKGSFPFFALNPIDNPNKPQFLLQKLKDSLQRMLVQNEMCAVLEPVKSDFKNNKSDDVDPNSSHQTSKAIDLILARIPSDSSFKGSIVLDIIDVTIGKSKNVVKDKLIKFLKTHLTLQDQNQQSIRLKHGSTEKQYPVVLRYFVFCNKSKEQFFSESLNEQKLVSDTLDIRNEPNDDNIFTVSFKDGSYCPLKEIGLVDIEEDIEFEKGQNDVEVLSYGQALKVARQRDSFSQNK